MAEGKIMEINGVEIDLKDGKAREDIEKLNTQLEDIAKQVENVGRPTQEQISTAVNNYLTENPIDSDISSITEEVKNNNLFDATKKVTSFTDNNGTTQKDNFTNYIYLKKGQRYVTNLDYTQFYFFDKNKQCTNSATYITSPVIVNGDGGYMLIKINSNVDESKIKILEGTDPKSLHLVETMLKNSKIQPLSKWYGKRWLLIGDSISTDSAGLANNGYGKLISRELGMILTNISVSGKTMKDGYEWLDNCSEQFDLITVMLGTNNQGYNCAIGSLNDSYYTAGTYDSNSSFYAQTQLMIEKLKTKYPKSVIIFLTPIKRTGVGGDAQYNDDNGYFKKLFTTEKYRDVIIDCCNYYSIPYIDLYNTIDPRTETNRTLYFTSATDGTHPNDLGHALFLAPVIKDSIEEHAPYYFNNWDTGGSDIPDIPVPPNTYTITNNLTNVTNSNTATSVNKNSSYTATLIADTDYILGNVTVTMGNTDVTSTVYSNGNINITSVTGNIVITAVATKTPTVTGLIHSYDAANLTLGATTLEDLTNNFDLDCEAVTESDVNNNYYVCNQSSKKIFKNRNSNFLLGKNSKDFTLAIQLRASDVYSTGKIHTGLINAFNITNSDYPSTCGRFILEQSATTGAMATGINLNYYDNTGNVVKEHYWNGAIYQNSFDVHVIRFKLDTLTVQLDRYSNKDGVLEHVTDTFNTETGLRFDGLNISGNLIIRKINIYAGVQNDEELETLAKTWLGVN